MSQKFLTRLGNDLSYLMEDKSLLLEYEAFLSRQWGVPKISTVNILKKCATCWK